MKFQTFQLHHLFSRLENLSSWKITTIWAYVYALFQAILYVQDSRVAINQDKLTYISRVGNPPKKLQ